jgi:Flp pilus assembly protein TadG
MPMAPDSRAAQRCACAPPCPSSRTRCRPIYALARLVTDDAGQGLTELALALPILLALVSAIIDGGWAFHQAGLVSAAAEAAQRAVAIQDTGAGNCAGAPPSTYTGAAQRAAQAAAPTLDPARLSVSLQYLEPACDGRMRTLAVSITYPVTALTPWMAPFLAGRLLTGEASGAVEEVPPPWWGQADQVQAQQAEIASQQTQITSQQAQIASLTSAYGQEAAEAQAEQVQLASLTSAYQSEASAYQAEAAQLASASSAANYYYQEWLSATHALPSGEGGGQQ